MARLRRTNAIKRPRKKFFTASNNSPRFLWWLAQQDRDWKNDADVVPPSIYSIPEYNLKPASTIMPVKPVVQYMPGIGVWDDNALWSDNVNWRD